MRSKYLPWLFILCLNFVTQDLASGQTYPSRGRYVPKQEIYTIHIGYQGARQFPSLDQSIGPAIAVAPFTDSRRGRQYVGHYMSARRISNYFISEPSPLEKAVMEFFCDALSQSGMRPVLVPSWDGKPEALKDLEADSILRIKIRRFWIEAKTVGRKTGVSMSVYFDTFLGVKKENKVFTQKMYIGKEMKDYDFTPERLEHFINRTLTNVFEDWSEQMIGRN